MIWEHSSTVEEFLARVLAQPPVVIGELCFGELLGRGELIGVPCMPEDVLRRAGRRLISEAAQVAMQRGARVIGLGALTAPATRGGVLLAPELPHGVTVTTGNAYTAVVARDNVLDACAKLGVGRRARVAVVGCTGSVGAAASRLLFECDLDLLLVGRSLRRVEATLPDLLARGATGCEDPAELRSVDVVLLLTSDTTARLRPGVFAGRNRPGVVIDVAQPPNVPREARAAFRRHGVVVAEGGVVEGPRLSCTYDLGIERNGIFACLAETYLFAREGISRHSIGPASTELAHLLERAAARHRLVTRPLDLGETDPLPESDQDKQPAIAT